MAGAIEAMATAFAALSDGRATVPLRLALETTHGTSLFMPAYLFDSGSAGAKVVTVTPGNPARGLPAIQAVALVLEEETGRVRALMDGTWLTALRTGAVGGLAARLLSREESSTVALFGAGVQARTQLEAVRCVRPIREVRVVAATPDSADRLVAELSGIEARRAASADEALDGADIVIAATTSAVPVFDGSRVAPGTHVTGVGSFTPDMREVDTALVTRARVFVDQREAVLAEAGDLAGPIADGAADASIVAAEIGELVLGRHPGRTSPDEITFFKSVGNAVQDVAVAALVLERAEAAERGVVVDL